MGLWPASEETLLWASPIEIKQFMDTAVAQGSAAVDPRPYELKKATPLSGSPLPQL